MMLLVSLKNFVKMSSFIMSSASTKADINLAISNSVKLPFRLGKNLIPSCATYGLVLATKTIQGIRGNKARNKLRMIQNGTIEHHYVYKYLMETCL